MPLIGQGETAPGEAQWGGRRQDICQRGPDNPRGATVLQIMITVLLKLEGSRSLWKVVENCVSPSHETAHRIQYKISAFFFFFFAC